MKTPFALLALALLFVGPSRSPFLAEGGIPPEMRLSYADVLPEAVRGEIADELRALPLHELFRYPALRFTSGEISEGATGLHTEAYLHFFERPHWEFWLLHHRSLTDSPDPASWTFHTIIVDKKAIPKRVYYLDFVPKRMARAELPQPVRFGVGCVTCHANGPRVIRPLTLSRTSDRQRALLGQWNERIASYGPMRNYLPTRLVGLTPVGRAMHEPLLHRDCVGCHNDQNGIRAGLRRLNRTSIATMLLSTTDPQGYYASALDAKQALMPLDSPKLDAEAMRCLFDWMINDTDRAPIAGCNRRGEPLLVERGPAMLPSPLVAVAESSVNTIPIAGFAFTGALRCQAACAGALDIDLTQLRTGIGLRDRHLREQLQIERFPLARAEVAPFVPRARTAAKVKLTLAGQAAEYLVPLQCRHRHCAIDRFAIQLSRHGITPPHFFGISVKDEVKVTGEIPL